MAGVRPPRREAGPNAAGAARKTSPQKGAGVKRSKKDLPKTLKVQDLHHDKPTFRVVNSKDHKGNETIQQKAKTSIQKGRYVILKQLGAGGMSKVYLARDQKMDCHVVVKEMMVAEATPDEIEYFQKRFQTEAKLLYRLSCRGIPKVTDFFSEEGANYLVMEYIAGDDLFTVIENRTDKRISIGEFVDWMWQLLETLSFLHSQEPIVIHRDIKPTNIMLTPQGKVILVDFGLATSLVGDNRTQTTIGTFGYASPEHYMGKLTTSSDIFSLGASFHFLLTSEEPARRVPFEYPPISQYRNDANEGIDHIIARMVEKDENERYQSAGEVLADLKKLTDYLNDSGEMAKLPNFNGKNDVQERQFLLGDSNINDSYHSELKRKFPKNGNSKDKKSSSTEPEKPGSQMFLEPEDEFSDDDDRQTMSGFLERFKDNIDKIKPVAAKIGPMVIVGLILALILGFGLMFGASRNKTPKPSPSVTGSLTNDKEVIAKSLASGTKFLEEEKFDKALQEFTKVIKLDKSNVKALMGRGEAFFGVKDYSKSFDDFSAAISLQKENIQAYWMRSKIHMARGAHAQARKDLDWLIKKSRRNDAGPYFYQRAITYYNQKQIEKAIGDLRVYLDIEKNSKDKNKIQYIKAQKQLSSLLRAQADEAIKAKNLPLAKRILNEAIIYDPDSEGNYLMMGLVYVAMDNVDKAIFQFEKAYSLNPTSARIKRDLARLYYRRGVHFIKTSKPIDAIKDLSRALKVNPTHRDARRDLADLYNKLGVTNFNQHNYKKALIYFDKSIDLDSDLAETLYNRGFTFYSLGRRDKAAADFRKALKLDPNSDLAARIPADLNKRPGPNPAPTSPAVTPHSQHTPPTQPGPQQKYLTLMKAHKALQAGKIQDTLRMADQVLSVDRTTPEAYVLKGEALLQMNRRAEAMKNFRQALQYAPRGGKLFQHAQRRYKKLSREGTSRLPKIDR